MILPRCGPRSSPLRLAMQTIQTGRYLRQSKKPKRRASSSDAPDKEASFATRSRKQRTCLPPVLRRHVVLANGPSPVRACTPTATHDSYHWSAFWWQCWKSWSPTIVAPLRYPESLTEASAAAPTKNKVPGSPKAILEHARVQSCSRRYHDIKLPESRHAATTITAICTRLHQRHLEKKHARARA